MIYELQWIKKVSPTHVLMVLAAEIISNLLGVFAALPFVLLFHRSGIMVFIVLVIVTSLVAAIFVKLYDGVTAVNMLVGSAAFLVISFAFAQYRHETGIALTNSYLYPLAIGYIFWSMLRRKEKI